MKDSKKMEDFRYKRDQTIERSFLKAETIADYSEFPEEVRRATFKLAYEFGESEGFIDILEYYESMMDLITEVKPYLTNEKED